MYFIVNSACAKNTCLATLLNMYFNMKLGNDVVHIHTFLQNVLHTPNIHNNIIMPKGCLDLINTLQIIEKKRKFMT